MIGDFKKVKEEEKKNIEEKTKKRGRRQNNVREEYVLNREQTKFFVDLSKDKTSLELVFKLLLDANKKNYGAEITFKELSIYALERLTPKDIEKIQEGSMTQMEKVERALNDYNQKNGVTLSLGDFLVKKL